MNPFLEKAWPSAHTALIAYIWESISAGLPNGLYARPEERVEIDESSERQRSYLADVGVLERWRDGFPPTWEPASSGGDGHTTVVAEPQIVRMDETPERWIEIRTSDGRVVTIIELLSPANKTSGWERYKAKQRDCLQTEVNLVEIDLLRGGRFALPVDPSYVRKPAGTSFFICCRRSWRPGTREVYVCPLLERLPAIRIPLRPTDADLILDLQPLVDRVYEVGRYYEGDFSSDPEPPFPADEAAWVEECLRKAGLREGGGPVTT